MFEPAIILGIYYTLAAGFYGWAKYQLMKHKEHLAESDRKFYDMLNEIRKLHP